MTTPTGTATVSLEREEVVRRAEDEETPIAVEAPWGIDLAPRMPFEIERIHDVFQAMPNEIAGLRKSMDAESGAAASVLRYDDVFGSSVTVTPIAFPLQASAPEFVRRLAGDLKLISSDRTSNLADSARVTFMAGGIIGADPPLHALIWAYSDRGYAFILISTSIDGRESVARAFAATLATTEGAASSGPGTLEVRPTCRTNAAGDNLKC